MVRFWKTASAPLVLSGEMTPESLPLPTGKTEMQVLRKQDIQQTLFTTHPLHLFFTVSSVNSVPLLFLKEVIKQEVDLIS